MSNAITIHENEREHRPAPMGSTAMTAREGFGEREITTHHETASSAVAAQAQASVQARYVMAERRPRDLDDVRVRLMKECRRPGFAAVARYRKPIGQGIEGPSIRFAEAATRAMGNVLTETPTIYDDAQKRIVRVSVTDLESNITYSQDITIAKVVERRSLKRDQVAISQRTNSQGATTFLVEATDDEILNKQNALISKAMRTQQLRVLPGDLLEEAMALCIETQRNADAQDPDAARKKLADAFASLGVRPSDLKIYLGHDLEKSTPGEIGELRSLYTAVRDGETSWAEALEHKTGVTAVNGEPTGVSKREATIAAVRGKKAPEAAPAKAERQPGED